MNEIKLNESLIFVNECRFRGFSRRTVKNGYCQGDIRHTIKEGYYLDIETNTS